MSARPRHCQICKREIPAKRAKIVPDTRMCIDCVKKVGGEFTLAIQHENLSKAGSLKKNYGSFELVKVRKRP